MAGVNKVILIEAYQSGKSTTDLAKEFGISVSTVRRRLIDVGVLRSRTEGVRASAALGKLSGPHNKQKRTFTDQWKARISESRKKHGEKYAQGKSLKPNGYVEITRGPDKGKMEHRVVAERMIGRELFSNECVHHIDGCRSNNDQGNLVVMTREDHAKHHACEMHPIRERDLIGRFV
jgi:hypothetical protein